MGKSQRWNKKLWDHNKRHKFRIKNGENFNFNFEGYKKNLIYIDIIYNPLETKTLKFLKDREIKVYNGLDMFIYQGQKAFYLWNKINPEIDEKLIEILLSKLKWRNLE